MNAENGENNNPISLMLTKEFLLLVVGIVLMGWLTRDGLVRMENYWSRDEYSHGYMIPLVALYLFWQKRQLLFAKIGKPGLLGIPALIAAIFLWMLGEMSGIFTLIQYGFILGVFAFALIWFGGKATWLVFGAIFYLIFMIPLPGFLYNNLSSQLQLVSSALGVGVIRLFDISVYLEGNVIDLGVYQLQVVEACSGLRYLFPLMSFGFLVAYIYRGPFWQRLLIFLSTIPITVLMNSFRIGVIGVTVEHFGIAAAEGFLHDFEGWIIFMACLAVLLIEIWIFYLFSAKSRPFKEMFDLDFGASDIDMPLQAIKMSPQKWTALFLVASSIGFSNFVNERVEEPLDRLSYATFPLGKGGWIGREAALEADVLDVLDLSDYIIGDFRHQQFERPVNFYSAWYATQRKGESIHSPRSCLPGGGWRIQKHTVEPVEEIDAFGKPLSVNRVVMQLGEHRQLVYYWFHGRGRIINNEYMAKWYIFWDSLTRNRTDGALMRLVTVVPDGSDIAEADQRMAKFLKDYYPTFSTYVPD